MDTAILGGHPYDDIASGYDALFSDQASEQENLAVIEAIRYEAGSVLDVGCGTGLFLDYVQPDSYFGIDPSSGMLSALLAKHPAAAIRQTKFERLELATSFDLVISLFGSMNYIAPEYVRMIPTYLSGRGRYFLMFMKPGYQSVTHEEFGKDIPLHRHDVDILPGRVTTIGNYFIIQGGWHEILSGGQRI